MPAGGPEGAHPFHRSRTAGNFGGLFGADLEGDDDGFGFGTGAGGIPRSRQAPSAQKVEIPLKLSLEELYTGTTKKRKVTRRIVDGPSGKSMSVEEVLEIPVKPGWKDGTRITFEGKGDELPGRPPQDLVFVVKQIQHTRFQREGDDLITTFSIPLAKALTAGTTIDIPSLDNRVLRVPLREVVTPGFERVVRGEGMPLSKVPGKKGNLRIRFNIQFPKTQLVGDEAANLQRLLDGK